MNPSCLVNYDISLAAGLLYLTTHPILCLAGGLLGHALLASHKNVLRWWFLNAIYIPIELNCSESDILLIL